MSEEIVAAALNIGCQMVIILFNFKSYDTYTIWHCKHYTQTHFVIMRECCLKMQKVSLKAKGKKNLFLLWMWISSISFSESYGALKCIATCHGE